MRHNQIQEQFRFVATKHKILLAHTSLYGPADCPDYDRINMDGYQIASTVPIAQW